ncbi:MAG: transposase [Desulfuromonadales bacterium]|nr:transposase [Desulfuromonadales bacterium]
MARANRHFIPGGIWHITHRCHKKEFLLKFAHDRARFLAWLREAHQRFDVQILNYTVTSDHVHLRSRYAR